MGMASDKNEDRRGGKVFRALRWALTGDPEVYKRYVHDKQQAHPGESPRRIARRVVNVYAGTGSLEGFATGMLSNPLLAVGGALTDIGVLLRSYASITAKVGYLANPRYFDDPDWQQEALLMLVGPKVIAKVFGDAAVLASGQVTKVLVRKHLSKEVLKTLQRFVLKWFGRKLTQRAIITKTVPIIGGLIGAGWNYGEVRIIGGRILRYHFDGVLS